MAPPLNMHDSIPWKNDLRKEIARIRKIQTSPPRTPTGAEIFLIEKFLFVSSYIIRKLIENNKVSDELEGRKFPLKYATVKDFDATCDYLSRRNFLKNYHFKKRTTLQLDIGRLINIFIHSYIFCISLHAIKAKDDARRIEIIVTSDWDKRRLYFVNLANYIKICELIIKDQVLYMQVGTTPGKRYRTLLIKSRKRSGAK